MKKKKTVIPAPTEREHARLSPSDASRWMRCGGAILLEEKLKPVDRSGESAELGTAAHELMAVAIETGKHPDTFKGQVFNKRFVADAAMCEGVTMLYDYVMAKLWDADDVWVESKVDISATGEGGHLDVGLRLGHDLYVIDYKNGVGYVDAEENEQLMLYALGLMDTHQLWGIIDQVYMVIVQPNSRTGTTAPRESRMNPGELRRFDQRVQQQRANIEAGNAPRVPGEKQCHWCKVRADCPEAAQYALAQAGLDFAEFVNPMTPPKRTPKEHAAVTAKALTLEQIEVAAVRATYLDEWVRAIRARIEAELLKGNKKLKHWKLIKGRTNRQWRDETALVADLARRKIDMDAYMPRRLAGLGVVESLLAKEQRPAFMKKHTTKPDGKPVVAPIDDPAPAYRSDASADFAAELNTPLPQAKAGKKKAPCPN